MTIQGLTLRVTVFTQSAVPMAPLIANFRCSDNISELRFNGLNGLNGLMEPCLEGSISIDKPPKQIIMLMPLHKRKLIIFMLIRKA
jgi:hypothetical protein